VIHGAPEVVHLAVDLHENLVQVPLPVRKGSHPTDPVSADLCCKHRAKSVPPITHSFVADLDAALVQKIFNIAKRKRKPNIHHDGQTDDLGARLEEAKGAAFCHLATLSARPARLNKFSSDGALTAP